ncbi:MAG: hypothetical protein VXZ67_03630, partial [Pseudomonadota bacterium]|nr:hypothetical protein [Pseudomonadota bacterium]
MTAMTVALETSKADLLAAIAGGQDSAAHSMPGWYYRDAGLFELEKSDIFANGWVCTGHASEVSRPGR